MADGTLPLRIRERWVPAASATREVRTDEESEWSGVREHGAAEVYAVALAARQSVDEMRTTSDRGAVARDHERGLRRQLVLRAQFPPAQSVQHADRQHGQGYDAT
jgi:hypothetical protein